MLSTLPNKPGARKLSEPFAARKNAALQVRPAQPDDAASIAQLYRIIYMVNDPRDATKHYPFPQFMQEAWLRTAIGSADFVWFAAFIDQSVVGTVVGVRNIGGNGKPLAEICGLVVHPEHRCLGVATRLLTSLHGELSEDTDLIFAETRTAEAGAWKIFRKFGYMPLGFEPAAHRTPMGLEPMLVQCLYLNGRVPTGQCACYGTREVQSLQAAVACLPRFGACISRSEPFSMRPGLPIRPAASLLRQPNPCVRVKAEATHRATRLLDAYFQQHCSLTLPLSFYGGNENTGGRITRRRYFVFSGDRPVALAEVVFDRTDRRARITALRSPADAPPLITELLPAILAFWDDGPMSVVLEIYAANVALQTELQACGFFPTVYYPAVAYLKDSAVDGVQMVYLHRFEMEDNLLWGRQVDWPQARMVIERIAELSTRLGKDYVN